VARVAKTTVPSGARFSSDERVGCGVWQPWDKGGGGGKQIVYSGPELSHQATTSRALRSHMVSPQRSNSMKQWLLVVKRQTEIRFCMMLGATRMLLWYKGPGRTVSPIEVTGKVDPLPTMMEEGKVRLPGWGKETILGLGVVWYEASGSATQPVGVGVGCDDIVVQGERA
jgi:hypothetical protein